MAQRRPWARHITHLWSSQVHPNSTLPSPLLVSSWPIRPVHSHPRSLICPRNHYWLFTHQKYGSHTHVHVWLTFSAAVTLASSVDVIVHKAAVAFFEISKTDEMWLICWCCSGIWDHWWYMDWCLCTEDVSNWVMHSELVSRWVETLGSWTPSDYRGNRWKPPWMAGGGLTVASLQSNSILWGIDVLTEDLMCFIVLMIDLCQTHNDELLSVF